MKYVGSFTMAMTLAVCAILATAPAGWAHRVNVFAYAEGDTIHVECSYSRSDRVRFGEITVQNAATGQTYLTGKTDEQGNFAFTVPPGAKAAKADLRILLKAGEGHQNDWIVEASEYLGASPAAPASEGSAGQSAAPAPKPAASAVASAGPAAVDQAALRRMISEAVETAVEKKIAPIRKILLDEKEAGPGLVAIVGGIGWIVGLAGIAAFLKSRGHGKGA